MLATWGLSLFLIGAVTAIFGNTDPRRERASRQHRDRRLFGQHLSARADRASPRLRCGLCLFVLNGRAWGLIARGTMQNPTMASTIGIDPVRVYAMTFAVGRGLERPGRRPAGADLRRHSAHGQPPMSPGPSSR